MQPEDRRAMLRSAAMELFAQRGYRATTMADIGLAVGIRGPSLYKHVRSKQSLLVDIMVGTMEVLLIEQSRVLAVGGEPPTQLRRLVEAHVRFHAAHRDEAFIGNREITNLEPPHLEQVIAMRASYEGGFRDVIERGRARGDFVAPSARLASYAILDMGMGVAAWFRPDGPHSSEELAYIYADQALRMLGAAA